MQDSGIVQSNRCSYNSLITTEQSADNRGDGESVIYEVGDMPYLLENNLQARQVLVLGRIGDMYTVRINGGAIRVRHTRLYETKEEAEKNIIRLGNPEPEKIIPDPQPAPEPEPEEPQERQFGEYRSPYDYWY